MNLGVTIVSLIRQEKFSSYILDVASRARCGIVYSHKTEIPSFTKYNAMFLPQEPIDPLPETGDVRFTHREVNEHHLKQCQHIVGLYDKAIKCVSTSLMVIIEEGIRFRDASMFPELVDSFIRSSEYDCISGVYPSRFDPRTNHIHMNYYDHAGSYLPNELVPRCVFPVSWAGAAISIWNTQAAREVFPLGILGVDNPFFGEAREVTLWENFAAKKFIEQRRKWGVNGKVWCDHVG